MKGIILHGGSGTRLRPLTYSGPKQLIPVANKPVSQYVLEDLVSCGVKDVAIVLGQGFPELVRRYYKDGSEFGARVTYVEQGAPLGISHAIGLCREFVKEDDFVVYLGDNLLQHGISRYVSEFERRKYDAMVLLKQMDDPSQFGVAQFDSAGKLVRLVEKPEVPPSKSAVIGVYFFRPPIFDSIKGLKPSLRGELEVTDAIQGLIDCGLNVGYSQVRGWWIDTGKKDDILYVNALILDERLKTENRGTVINSRIEGRVQIGRGTTVICSTMTGPVAVADDCRIENSTIGPHTSIGRGTKMKDTHVEYSVIEEASSLEGVERVEESLIGKHSRISQTPGGHKALKVHLGDFSEVVL